MELSKEQIAEILYKSCEENNADIGSINFNSILDGLEKHLNEYLKSIIEEQKEEIRRFLIDEDFEGLAERI